MNKPRTFRDITGDDLDLDDVSNEGVTFVDNATYTLRSNSMENIEAHIGKFLLLLMVYYGANRMKLNDDKTTLLILKEQYRKRMTINASNGERIHNTAQIKILGK